MDDFKLVLDVALLKAAVLFVADKKDTRKYLGTVHVYTKGGKVMTEAANGHAAFVGVNSYETPESLAKDVDVCIPATTLKDVLTGVRGTLVRLEFTNGIWRLESTPFYPFTEREYPRISQVVPTSFSGEVAQFDPRYIALFGRASKLLRNKDAIPLVTIRHNGAACAALVGMGVSSAFGVLMPRMGDELPDVPGWFKEVHGRE